MLICEKLQRLIFIKNYRKAESVRSMSKLLAAKMASARNIREIKNKPLSPNKRKDSTFQSIPEKIPKNANEHLKLMIEGINIYPKEKVFAEMIKILQKPLNERNSLDIKFLALATSNIKFFQKTAAEMGANTYEKICNYIEYSHYNAGEVIFNLGDKGDKFYVILKGRVGVSIRMTKEVISLTGEQSTVLALGEVANLNVGDGFGELALLNDGPRLATIVCKEESHFATLSKENFRSILAANEKEKVMRKINFLLSVPAFSKLRGRTISTLIYHFAAREFMRDTVVYREGDEPKMVYIILSGEFKISKFTFPGSNGKLSSSEFSTKSGFPKKRIDISILGSKEIFGEEEIIYGLKKRNYTVTCNSLIGEAYAISKEDFYKRIISTKQEGLEIMEHMIKMKKNLHDDLFSHNKILLDSERRAKQMNPFPTLSDIFQESEPVPYMIKNRPKSLMNRRASQIVSDFSQKIIHSESQRNERLVPIHQNFIRQRGNDTSSRNYHSAPPTSQDSTRKQDLIQPNLGAYLEFIERKWREMKGKKNEKESWLTIFSDKKKSEALITVNKIQKKKVERDISSLKLNYGQIIEKLRVKKTEEGIKEFTPKQCRKHIVPSHRKVLSLHRIKPRNLEFSDEKFLRKDELDCALTVRKI